MIFGPEDISYINGRKNDHFLDSQCTKVACTTDGTKLQLPTGVRLRPRRMLTQK